LNDVRPSGDRGRVEIAVKRKSFRSAAGEDRDVLVDIAFELAPAEMTALAAPSGCGKTTLLKIIAGLDRDFEGDVASSAGRIGVVFQEPRLLPWRSVEDNIRIAAPRATEPELDALFHAFHLDAHRRHYPRELSLGLARRVALVRALAVQPDLLLLDEPFVSLDERLASELRQELIALVTRSRITSLVVTHDIAEAVQLAERVIVLDGHPARIVADYPIGMPRSERTPAFVNAMADRIRSTRSATSTS
jgi:NitT/TauT family transport system ATP-binding protein